MQEIRVLSDVIKFILCGLGAGTRFTTNASKIHSAFYALSQDTSLGVLFKDFVFDTSKGYPHTQTVRHALDRLQKSDLLIIIGLEQFEISETLSKLKPHLLFDETEVALLKKASEKFYDIIKGETS